MSERTHSVELCDEHWWWCELLRQNISYLQIQKKTIKVKINNKQFPIESESEKPHKNHDNLILIWCLELSEDANKINYLIEWNEMNMNKQKFSMLAKSPIASSITHIYGIYRNM